MSKVSYAPVGGKFLKLKKSYAAADGVLHKLKTGYAVVDGMYRKILSNGANVTYTGTHTLTQIDIDGVPYNLLTMTGSGVLTVDGDGVQVWCCGGGSGGSKGNGGSGGHVASGEVAKGSYAVTIGAGGDGDTNGNATTITKDDAVILNADGGTVNGPGGSGYGGGGKGQVCVGGKGDGVSTIPFGIAELLPHCAGGHGGDSMGGTSTTNHYSGGKGGTNGGDGASSVNYTDENKLDGTPPEGSEHGGGVKGLAYPYATDGGDATFYGSAGGGAGYGSNMMFLAWKSPGKGYQGVAYAMWSAA